MWWLCVVACFLVARSSCATVTLYLYYSEGCSGEVSSLFGSTDPDLCIPRCHDFYYEDCVDNSTFKLTTYLPHGYVAKWEYLTAACSGDWHHVYAWSAVCAYGSGWGSTSAPQWGREACESGWDVQYTCGTDASCAACTRSTYGPVGDCTPANKLWQRAECP
eukprot:TRINITY_DN4417_c0_g1_i1.p1 TRINITY_DN4417_c0_g1~~TRINITY_DN4417_c0_g1_i1.p1  ORF type:complete len:176 (-),score=23.99 TRINITY_DN4417_c0_g1_i1:76-561(-)